MPTQQEGKKEKGKNEKKRERVEEKLEHSLSHDFLFVSASLEMVRHADRNSGHHPRWLPIR